LVFPAITSGIIEASTTLKPLYHILLASQG
jgi:hypothetical protein